MEKVLVLECIEIKKDIKILTKMNADKNLIDKCIKSLKRLMILK